MEDKNNLFKNYNHKLSDEFELPLNDSVSLSKKNSANNVNTNEINKINNKVLESDLAPYIMTIELDKTRTDKIKIFHNSNASELAFEFCKKNSLDFNSLNFLTQEIDKIIKSYLNEIITNNQNYQDCIEEVEEENLNSEVKLSESVKIGNKNSYTDLDIKSVSELKSRKFSSNEEYTEKEIYSDDINKASSCYKNNREPSNDRSLEEINSKDNLAFQDNHAYIPNNKYNNFEPKEELKEKNLYNHKVADNISNFQCHNSREFKNYPKFNFNRLNNDTSLNYKENPNYSYQSFLQNWRDNTNKHANNSNSNILSSSRNQQYIKKNERKNNCENSYNSNQVIQKKENIHNKLYNDAKFRKIRNIMPDYRIQQSINNASKQSLTTSKINSEFSSKIPCSNNDNCKEESKLIKPDSINKQYSRESSFHKSNNLYGKTSYLKKKLDDENDCCTFSPAVNPLSERIVFNNYLNKGKSPSQALIDKKQELYECHKINLKKREKLSEDYYNSFNFQPKINKNEITASFFIRQENYKIKTEERKAIQLEESLIDKKNGQKLFTPRIMKRQSSQRVLNNFNDYMYSFANKYETKKNASCLKRDDTFRCNSNTKHTNLSTEKLLINKKNSSFVKIFNILDGDQDGLISIISSNYGNLPDKIKEILKPIKYIMLKEKISLNQKEFISLIEEIYENLEYDQKKLLLNIQKNLPDSSSSSRNEKSSKNLHRGKTLTRSKSVSLINNDY